MSHASFILIALAVMLGLASPAAHAQRDPFEPAIETAGPGTGEEGSVPEGPEAPAPAPARPEALADTGAEGGPWLALSYVLVAFGVAMLVMSRVAGRGSG